FVAVFGFATDQEWIAIGLATAGVGLAWWMLGGLSLRLTVRALAVLVFATGTAWWWAAAVGSTWYLAHLVAADAALLAVGVALRHDRDAPDPAGGQVDDDEEDGPQGADEPVDDPDADRGLAARLWAATWPLDGSQVLAGLLLGI